MAVTIVSSKNSRDNFNRILQSKQQFPTREEHNITDIILITDKEATTTNFMRTNVRTHDAEAKAENFGLEATFTSRT